MDGESGMKCESAYDEKHALVRVVYTGPSTLEDYIEGAKTALDFFKKHRTERCLLDLRKVENKAGLDSLFELPDAYRMMNVPMKTRLAILATRDESEEPSILFYETICLNRGWMVKVFYGEAEAIDWLSAR
jgi:hypothetical protein